ncbi:MAG: dihydrolipoyl dehydrogenase [Syntrophobacteraceae bacterium]|jgi:dihydrolipoamide dehydrogenase
MVGPSGEDKFDLIVIGAGPGGYVAAIRAAQLGMKTACIERDVRPGGVCLNVGCIPSKALLESTEYYRLARDGLGEHAIHAKDVSIDLAALMERKERIVSGLTDNVGKLMEQSGVRLIRGSARIISGEEIEVLDPGQAIASKRYGAGALLLATGSEPVPLPFLPFDGELVVSSTEALKFESAPRRLGIVGGGYIGLELGSVWSRLGSEVTVIEALPRIATTLDGQVGRLLERMLRREGFNFRLLTKLTGAEKVEDGVRLFLDSNGGREEAEFDRVLVAVGRRPLTGGLGLDEIGIRLDPRGFVTVDENYRTNIPGVYAIGDLIPGPMLAHKASAEGRAAVERLAGLAGEVNYDAIASVIYTSPEAASVGKTEEELKNLGADYRSAVYPFSGTGRARCLGQTDGFVKILAHRRSGRVLGVHIIGPRASELIAECVVAVELHASVKDLSHIIHAHPTLSEAVRESAAMLLSPPK